MSYQSIICYTIKDNWKRNLLNLQKIKNSAKRKRQKLFYTFLYWETISIKKKEREQELAELKEQLDKARLVIINDWETLLSNVQELVQWEEKHKKSKQKTKKYKDEQK